MGSQLETLDQFPYSQLVFWKKQVTKIRCILTAARHSHVPVGTNAVVRPFVIYTKSNSTNVRIFSALVNVCDNKFKYRRLLSFKIGENIDHKYEYAVVNFT